MSKNSLSSKSNSNARQRLACVTLGLTGTVSLANTAAMANSQLPVPAPPTPAGNWHAATNSVNNSFMTSAAGAAGVHHSSGAVNGFIHGVPVRTVHSSLPTAISNNLNLSSISQTFLADNLADFKQITIQVGGTTEVVTLNTKLTDAEVVAAEQVLTGGSQTVKLTAGGAADGGTVTLNSAMVSALDSSLGGSIGSLTIAHGVKVIDDVSLLTVGSLSNYGSLQTASTSAGNTDIIAASTIANASGGSIASYNGNSAGLVAADPSLTATTSITNSGTISSAGNLTLSAPVVTNAATAHGSAPTMVASQNVNISTQTLNNSGTIEAVAGNINTVSSGPLTVTNTGALEAKRGNINLSTTDANLNISGGNYLSQNVNLNSGSGNLNANFGDVTGEVNASGTNVLISATDTKTLQLGNVASNGDPLVAEQGNLIIDGTVETVTDGAPLTLIASGNIVSSSANSALDTSSTTGNGGNITLMAGANFTVSNGTVTVSEGSGSGSGSTTGGHIDLTGGGSAYLTSITTDSTAGNAGAVQLIAYSGSAAGSGVVTLATNSNNVTQGVGIDATSTYAGGSNGNILIIAGATSGTAVTIGNSSSSAFAFRGGNVTVDAAVPNTQDLQFNSTGLQTGIIQSSGGTTGGSISIYGNSFLTGSFTANTGGSFSNYGYQILAVGPNPTGTYLNGAAGQNVTINAAEGITVGNVFTFGGGGTGGGSGNGTTILATAGGVGGAGGDVTLNAANGSIYLLGTIDVSGGGGGGGAGGSAFASATAGGAGGTSGTVTLTAGQNVVAPGSANGDILAYDGGAGGAGGAYQAGIGGGGGGGGSGFGGGGGGGGGGIGTSNANLAAGGGGGSGFNLTSAQTGTTYYSYSGAGGGGSVGNSTPTSGTPTTGGGGGSLYGYGSYGVGNYYGYYPSGSTAGLGAGDTASPGGAGAANLSAGGGGGAAAAGGNVGSSGGGASAVAGHGVLTIEAGGSTSSASSATAPITIAVGTLTYSTSGTNSTQSAYIQNVSGSLLTIATEAQVGNSGTLSISNVDNPIISTLKDGSITVNGAVLGGIINLTAVGTVGPNNIVLNGSVGETTTLVNIVAGANNGTSPGTITTTSYGIEAKSVNLSAGGNISASIEAVSNLTALSAAGNVAVTQTSADGTLALGLSGAGAGDSFSVSTTSPLNLTAGIAVAGGNVNLSTVGSTNAITLGAAINTGTTGSITLSAGGAITDTAAVTLTSGTATLGAGTNGGTEAAPILTSVSTINSTVGAAGNLYVSDANANALTFNGQSTSSGALVLNSVASQLNIIAAPLQTVTINDTGTSANILLNSSNSNTAVLGGSGVFTVTTTGNINDTANTKGILGSTVNLTSKNGSVGTTSAVATATPILILSAAAGSVNVSDSLATSSVTGTASTSFTLSDTVTGGTGLTIGKAISAASIVLSTTASAIQLNAALGNASSTLVEISAAGNLNAVKAAVISGQTVDLYSSTGNVGSSTLPISTKAITLSTSSAGSTYISQTGNLSLGAQTVGNAGTFSITTAGNLNVSGNLTTGATISLTSTGTGNTLTTVDSIGNATAAVILASAGNIDDNGALSGSTVSATTKTGTFTEAAGAVINGNLVSISAGGGVSAGGLFEAAGSNSALQVSTAGTFTTTTVSSLGTSAKPFSSVIVSDLSSSAASLDGKVYANGVASGDAIAGLQLTTKGPLNIGSSSSLNDSSDLLTSSSTISLGGSINDTSLSVVSKGALTISADVTTLIGTISGPTVSNTGTIMGLNALTINTTAAGGLSNSSIIGGGVVLISTATSGIVVNNASANLDGNNLTISSSNINNAGNIDGASTLTLTNPSGNLSITGQQGSSISTAEYGSINLTAAKGSITVGSAIDPFNLSNTSSFYITASGTFTSPITNIAVIAGAAGNGGTINITASNLVSNSSTSGPVILIANGTSGSGGSISLNLSGTASSGLTIGTATGDYEITAHGQNGGGTVNLSTPGQLTVLTSALNLNATQANYTSSGANLTLSGTKGVLINGNLDTSFDGGNTGNISVNSGAKTVFTVGAVATSTNGQINITDPTNALVGSNVTISDATGVSLAAGDTITATSGLVIASANLTNSGSIITPAFTIQTTGSLTVSALSGTFTPLTAYSAISTGGNVTVNGSLPTANDYTFAAPKGAVVFGTNTTSLTSSGGSINIEGKTLTIPKTGLTINASAKTANTAGGTVNIDLTGTTNILIGTGMSSISISTANTGNGANGNVTVITGGNLTVNQANLNLGSASGSGSLTLAGKVLNITGATDFNALNLSNLSLASNSSAAFVLGGATGVTNGITDSGLQLTAGQITIVNNGGAIYQGTATGLTADSATDPAVTITAKGDIGQSTTPISINASEANSSLNAVSTTGNAYISISAGNEKVSASAAKTLQLASSGAITASGPISAATLNLSVGSISALTTSAKAISATVNSGVLNITDSQTALVTLNAITSAGGVAITSTGALTNLATINSLNGAIALTAGGKITTKAAISAGTNLSLTAGGTSGSISQGATLTAADTATLTAAGKGTITESKTTYLLTAATADLNATSGNIGTSLTAPYTIDAGTLNISDPGTAASVYINNSSAEAKIGTINIGSATTGKTFDYNGAIIGAAATINAPTIVISSSNLLATIATNATSLQIITTGTSGGNITVNDSQTAAVKLNTLTAGAGSIDVTTAGNLTTSGIISASGNIQLAGGNNGNVVIGNSVTSTGSSTSTTINSIGNGTISDLGSGTYKVAASSVYLNTASGDIGSTKVAFRTQAPELQLNTNAIGNVYAVNTNLTSAGIDTLALANVGSLTISDTNSNTKNTGTFQLGNLTASTGSIAISTNEQTLNVAALSNIATVNGNISLLNTYAANGSNLPLITTGSPVTIHASSTGSAATGNIFIALGALPTTASLRQGQSPAGATVQTAGVTVFFGTTSNPNGSITAVGSDTLTGDGRDLSFTTGKNAASQISLGTNNTIIADPPAGVQTFYPVNSNSPAQTPSVVSKYDTQAANVVDYSSPILTGTSAALAQGSTAGQLSSLNNLGAATANNAAVSQNMTNSLTQTESAAASVAGDSNKNKITMRPLIERSGAKKLEGGISNIARQTLTSGALLITPQQATVVDTPQGAVRVAAGSVALLLASEQGLAVYDLHDSHKGSITVEHNSDAKSLVPGRSIFIGADPRSTFEEVNPTPFVTFRHLNAHSVGKESKVYEADFEIMSMLRGLTPLRSLVHSSNHEKQKVAVNMLKTAAILAQLTQSGEQFSYYIPQAKLALAR